MIKIGFVKMVASGNDFIVIKDITGLKAGSLRSLAKEVCARKYGIGADGMLLLERSRRADIHMRIFNADGSEAEMCGNGARCVALYLGRKASSIETRAGIIQAKVIGSQVKIHLTVPEGMKTDIPLYINNRRLKVNFINTGVPHAVIFTEGLEKINVADIGRQLRFHKYFSPHGTNVDFIETIGRQSIKIRTYERGVEGETLACGTGSVASALIFALKTGLRAKISVHTASKEVLFVEFKYTTGGFRDVWLEGKAWAVFNGCIIIERRRG
ncbi:MAG: diaminopimelate epimerase [Candidatus Omnitrophota bacterium]